MANPAISIDIFQSLDVRKDPTTQISLYLELLHFASQGSNFLLRQVLPAYVWGDPSFLDNLHRSRSTNAEDIGQSYLYPLVIG
jgi:hypothetical protein